MRKPLALATLGDYRESMQSNWGLTMALQVPAQIIFKYLAYN